MKETDKIKKLANQLHEQGKDYPEDSRQEAETIAKLSILEGEYTLAAFKEDTSTIVQTWHVESFAFYYQFRERVK